MISPIDELAADAKRSFERALEPLRSVKGLGKELLLEIESESLLAFKATALAAKGSDDLDEIANRWREIAELYDWAHGAIEKFNSETPVDPDRLSRVLWLLDHLRQRARRLHALHA